MLNHHVDVDSSLKCDGPGTNESDGRYVQYLSAGSKPVIPRGIGCIEDLSSSIEHV